MQDTLDPPGTIAIIGGGPLGIEAALYGRYLGYDVILFEADELVHRLRAEPDQGAPPNCTSPLGRAAIAAQRGLAGTTIDLRPETTGEWATSYFDPIAQSDLLRGRLHTFTEVLRIELAAPEEDSKTEPEDPEAGELPPDFLIHFRTAATPDAQGEEPLGTDQVARFEGVIDAREDATHWIGPGDAEVAASHAYLFRLARSGADVPTDLDQIRQLYARLWGRDTLDVYANLGG